MTMEELRETFPDYKIIYRKNQHYSYIQLEKKCVKNTERFTLADELKNLALNIEPGATP